MPTVDRDLLSKYLRPEWPRAALLAALLLSTIGFQLAGPLIAGAFINQAKAGDPFSHLIRIATLFLVVALLTQVASVFQTRVAEDLGWRATNALRANLTQHVLGLDATFHAEHTPGELIERIDSDVSSIADFFATFLVQLLGSALFLLGILVVLFLTDWRLGALLTAFSLTAAIFMIRAGGPVASRAAATRRAAADLSGYIEERLSGLPDIKANGADGYVIHRLHERLAERYRTAFASSMAASVFNSGVGVIFALGTGGALALSAVLHQSGAMTLGTIFVVFRYTGMLQQPLEQLTTQMNSLQQATGSIVRVRELLEAQPTIVTGTAAAIPDGALTVELERVSFAYGATPILQDVSFHVEPGTVLGLLGRTGAGKTTIARLLFRLHDPLNGAIRLGGLDLRDLRLDYVHERVGFVTQDVQLFQGTLRDNVTLFDSAVTNRRLADMLEVLELGQWLRELPAGLDTILGAGGRGLSAGEAQLIALSRVFLKNPGLVILDEASSRLDPVTEERLERAIAHLLDGRTGIVIAHHLTTIERADSIAILESGRVVEFGPRAELMLDPTSRFSRLVRAGTAEVQA